MSIYNVYNMLILLGSSIGMMEEEVLFYKAPLYGRRTASLEVLEMPFSALAEFFPAVDLKQRLEIYSVFGSIPAYIERLNNIGTIHDAISDLIHMLRDKLVEAMTKLSLHGMKGILDETVAADIKQRATPEKLLLDLLEAELGERNSKEHPLSSGTCQIPI